MILVSLYFTILIIFIAKDLFGLKPDDILDYIYKLLPDCIKEKNNRLETSATIAEQRNKSLGAILAMMCMVDGSFDKAEQKTVLNYLRKHFEREQMNVVVAELNHWRNKSYTALNNNFETHIQSIIRGQNSQGILAFTELMFDVANATDGILPEEWDLLQRIMQKAGLSEEDQSYLKSKYEPCFRQKKEKQQPTQPKPGRYLDRCYRELGLKSTASQDDIRKAYHKLAKKYHPDTVQDPALKEIMSEKFKRITNSYEHLNNKNKASI